MVENKLSERTSLSWSRKSFLIIQMTVLTFPAMITSFRCNFLSLCNRINYSSNATVTHRQKPREIDLQTGKKIQQLSENA